MADIIIVLMDAPSPISPDFAESSTTASTRGWPIESLAADTDYYFEQAFEWRTGSGLSVSDAYPNCD